MTDQKKYKDTLINLGLSEKEARVYLVLLNLGSGTADEIAKQSKLNRSTTYVQIKSLMSDGLVSTFKRGKKTFFAPESPSHLENILEWRRRELSQKTHDAELLIPNLMKIFSAAGSRPTTRLFEGKTGLTSLRNEVLKQKSKEVLIITNYDLMRKVFTEKELQEFTLKREKLKIKSHVLYVTKEKEDFKPYKNQAVKRLNSNINRLGTDIYIYDDTVSFASCDGDIVGLSVMNKSIANTMRALFWGAWGSDDK